VRITCGSACQNVAWNEGLIQESGNAKAEQLPRCTLEVARGRRFWQWIAGMLGLRVAQMNVGVPEILKEVWQGGITGAGQMND